MVAQLDTLSGAVVNVQGMGNVAKPATRLPATTHVRTNGAHLLVDHGLQQHRLQHHRLQRHPFRQWILLVGPMAVDLVVAATNLWGGAQMEDLQVAMSGQERRGPFMPIAIKIPITIVGSHITIRARIVSCVAKEI